MDLNGLLVRLADARDLNVPGRERENLCSLAHGAIIKLRGGFPMSLRIWKRRVLLRPSSIGEVTQDY